MPRHRFALAAVSAIAVSLLARVPTSQGADCNNNHVDDQVEIAAGDAADCNANGVPDECDLAPSISARLAPPYFETARPHFVSAADLDRDGDVDLLAGRALLENDGDAGFTVARELPTDGREPVRHVIADLDGDGLDDVAMLVEGSAGRGAVLGFRDDGNGALALSFDVSVRHSLVNLNGVEMRQDTLAAADVDGDADLDLLVAPGDDETRALALLVNTGGHAFEPVEIDAGAAGPYAVLPIDADGDRRVDLVVASRRPPFLTLLRNAGAGSFEAARDLGADRPLRSLAAGDLDGDGDADLVAADASTTSIRALWNDGNGVFGERSDLGRPGGHASSVTVVDLDRDTRADIVATAGEDVLLLLGRGDRSFDRAVRRTGSVARTTAIDDLDGDGELDLATTLLFPESILVMRGAGVALFPDPPQLSRPSFPATGVFPFDFLGATTVVPADVDADGAVDVVAADADGRLRVSLATGELRFARSVVVPGVDGARSVGAFDIEGDGDADLVIGSFGDNGNAITVLGNDGVDRLARLDEFPVVSPPTGFAAADVDGDGHVDIVAVSGPVWLRNTGDGKLEAPRAIGAGEATGPMLAVADIDGDRRPDLIAGRSGGPVGPTGLLFYQNAGGGVFEAPRTVLEGRFQMADLIVADFNGDGAPDVATAFTCFACAESVSTIEVLINDGAGVLAAPADGGALDVFRIGVRALLAADLDRDGDDDLVIDRFDSGAEVLASRGDGSFAAAGRLDTQAAHDTTRQARLLDLDGDDAPELVAFRGGALQVRTLMTVDPVSMDADRDGVPDECSEPLTFVRADANNDGERDLSDAIFTLAHLFLGDVRPTCLDALDTDDSGTISITDSITMLDFLFRGGPPPPAPLMACGPDPTPDALDCASFDSCR